MKEPMMFNISDTQWVLIKWIIGLSIFFTVGELIPCDGKIDLREAKAQAFSIRTCKTTDEIYEVEHRYARIIVTCIDGTMSESTYEDVYGEDVKEIFLKGK